MNVWGRTFLERCRDVLRFLLWTCLVLQGFMLGVFSVLVTYELLTHLWSYLKRHVFSQEW
ncbi:MAG: hypothetical protein IT436_16020 [Phycisphaerales bacterium]|nr:hypothetical protein [Phycisphaerales bacterium]